MSKGGGQSPTGDMLLPLLEKNYASAQALAAKPFTPYTGRLSAGVPTALMDAQNAALDAANFRPSNIAPASSGVYGLQLGAPAAAAVPAPISQMQPFQALQPSAAIGSPQMAVSTPTYGSDHEARRAQRDAERDARQADRDARRDGRGGYDEPPIPPTLPPTLPPTMPPGSVNNPAAPYVSAMQGLEGLDAYLNPFIQSVIDTSMADLERSRQIARNADAAAAAAGNAWGGGRHGVADALTNEAYDRTAADTITNLRMAGFDTGAGLLMGDKDRLLQNQQFDATLQQQANLANQAAGLDAAQTNLAGAQMLGGLAMNQYGIDQAALDAQLAEFMRQINYPYVQQDVLNKALGMFGSMQGQWTPPSYPFGNAFAEALPGMVYGPQGYFKP